MRKRDRNYHPVHSLSRLLIGGVLLAGDELQRQIRLWEQETRHTLDERERTETVFSHMQNGASSRLSAVASPEDTPADLARYAMIGLLFETRMRVLASKSGLGRVEKLLGGVAAPLMQTFDTNPLLSPVRKQVEGMVARGEREVDRWIALGRIEDQHSRVLAQTALQFSTESTIHSVVENPEVRDLVQQQSAGLADEVVEELRERAVSIDTYLERLIRRRLRRKPREDLPEPSDAVRAYAQSVMSAPEE